MKRALRVWACVAALTVAGCGPEDNNGDGGGANSVPRVNQGGNTPAGGGTNAPGGPQGGGTR